MNNAYQIKKINNRILVHTGYYQPSNANWAYQVFMVIDNTGAKLYKSVFGSEYELKQKYETIELSVQALAGYNWKQIREMPDIYTYKGQNY